MKNSLRHFTVLALLGSLLASALVVGCGDNSATEETTTTTTDAAGNEKTTTTKTETKED